MIYDNIVKGKFISRPNRFIANVEIMGKKEVVHVKNTGRCRELLTEGATVFCEKSNNPNRKTKYDLISVYKGKRLINMDSQAPNKVFYEYLQWGKCYKDLTYIKGEYTYGDSRIDFYCESEKEKFLIEVKGVTLENEGVVMFPDAPTIRGIKHIDELIKAKEKGYRTAVAFVIQMDNIKYFTPNKATHKDFADALKRAEKAGVEILCLDCIVTENTLKIDKKVEYIL
ncbi:MAG: DNA/RNA nuclease SfsA [Oscillospiraceae bacterium]|nr:DNA/RNA nuclease SfsA [Oscillospiraceae bacterium]